MGSSTAGSELSPNPDEENVGQEVNANGKNSKNGRSRKDRTVSRRTLLGVSGAAGAAALALITRDAPGVSAAADRGEGAIPATIERIVLPKTIHARNSNGSVVITMEDAAHFSRYRASTHVHLADYLIGDEIVAEGQWRGDVFVADALVSCYRLVVGRIIGKDGSALHTTNGTIYLTLDTRVRQEPQEEPATNADLAIGDEVRISAWRDPSSGDLVAVVIGWQGRASEA